MLEDFTHYGQQSVAVHGLFQILVGSFLGSLNGRLNRGVARDQNDGDGGVGGHDLAQQLDAGHAGQIQVGDDQVEALLGKQLERSFAARRRLDLVPFALQDVTIDFPLPPFVVDNENGSSGHRRAAVSDIEDESQKSKVEGREFRLLTFDFSTRSFNDSMTQFHRGPCDRAGKG